MTAPASLPASAAPASAGNAAPSDTILVLGDSLSAEYGLARGTGWVALLERRLAQQHRHWTLVNASISGETSAGGRSRIDALLQKHRPRVVIIELGGNDALRGLDLRGTEANLDYLASSAHAIGARVLMIGMMVPPNYGPAYADAFAQIFSRAKYMNHSNMPNLIEVNHDNTSINVAIVDIKAGEELTCNYFDFDLDAHRKLDMYD